MVRPEANERQSSLFAPLKGALLSLSLLLTASEALAVPAFARRYEVACTFCHQGFPKLNRAGELFKARGFRLSDEDKFSAGAWIKSGPASGRLLGTRNLSEGRTAWNAGYLKVLSAGNLGSRFSYWVDDAWLGSKEETTHLHPDNAWVRFEFKPLGRLYAKVGRFEMDLPFTQARTPHLFPYSIYATSTGLEPDTIGAYQEGVELGGGFGATRLSVALVKGRNYQGVVKLAEAAGVGHPGKFDANLFVRGSRGMGKARLGAFAYVGRNELVARLSAARVGVARDKILRLGVDARVWLKGFNLYGVGMYGSNSNSLLSASFPRGTGESLGFSGGFLSADYHFRDHIALTGRIQTRTVDLGGASVRNSLTSFLPGVHLVLWKLKFSAQSSLPTNKLTRLISMQVETAF